MIICAAIKVEHTDEFGNPKEPLVVCGHRHGNCFKVISHLDINCVKMTQGFINHKGEFLDRKEAFKHAKEIGQCNETQRYYWEDHKQEELYSEDLY